ncbi:MAG: class I SAM-dependent methyltransferase [Chloroflexi bacterium]|nr:class I SAM-dependent methyltransferase [Chloroflexota bacterium]
MRRAWRRLILFGFDLLYGPLARYYDFISGVISAGQWQEWGQTVVDHLSGPSCLEIGPGPGHLLQFLRHRGFEVVAVERSPAMVRMIQRRWQRQEPPPVCRGNAQILPFPQHHFDNIVMSFPAPYVLEDSTLLEVQRCLHPAGRLVIVSDGWQTDHRPASFLRNFLLSITSGEASILPQYLRAAGFSVKVEQICLPRSRVDLIIALPIGETDG